jgi:ATP-binding cassette subfamily B protein
VLVEAAAFLILGLAAAVLRSRWPLLDQGRRSAGPLFEFLDQPADVAQELGADALPPLTQQIELDNVSLREPGGTRLLLEDISLRIPAGLKVGLVGGDEREKHAFACLLPRFLDPTAGEVRFDENNLRWVTLESLRGQIGLVLRHSLVFNDTVLHNIGCGSATANLPQITDAAKLAHAHQFIQKLPRGYETVIGDLGYALDIGEQFRIALARAILRQPSLLIIEEPAAGEFDADTLSLLDDTYSRILEGRSVLLLPHRLATLRLCDQLILLQGGQVVAAGSHQDLLASNELYQHLHYLEFNPYDEAP